jgi:Glucodextranase, domain B
MREPFDFPRPGTRRPGTRVGAALVASLGALVALGTGCDAPLADDPAIDPDAPVVRISSPARGAYLGDVSSVVVTGTVLDESPIRSLTINGEPVELAADGSFSAALAMAPTGTALFTAEATDVDGNVGRETRAFSSGPLLATGLRSGDAIVAAISDNAFLAVGNAAASLIATTDLGAWIASSNPVIRAGSPNGPDCLFGDVSIGKLDVASAAIELLPTVGGLELVAELRGVTVPMHLRYAALCVNGQSDVAMTAAKVRIAGRFTVAIKNGRFDIKLVAPAATFDGFHLELPGLPGEVAELLDLDHALGPVLSWAVEQLAAPLLGDALAGAGGATRLPVLGKTLDLEVTPTELTFSPVDAQIRLDTRFHFDGDLAGRFVAAPNVRPSMSTSGLRIAVSDDAINSLLAGFWSAHGMDLSVDLTTGDYGGLGQLYDRVELQGLLPLSLRAEGGTAQLVIPELVVSFERGDQRVTQIALNGSIDLAIDQGGDGALRLATGTPRLFVDILQEGVQGSNPLASSQLETLVAFALTRLTGVASTLIGAVPLPSGPGAQLRDVRAGGQRGYLLIDGAAD